MASFHVFVEGPTDSSPGALDQLASAIATHYGLGAPDLLARLQKGRFRVKTNADRATADTYARDLQRLGARVTIEEATPANSQRSTPLPFPAVRPATPPAGTPRPAGGAAPGASPSAVGAAAAKPPAAPPSALAAAGAAAPAAAAPPSALAAAGAAARPSTPPPGGGQQFQSGLSAAFSGEMPAADLGALADADSAFSLASLDGVDDSTGASGAFGPSSDGGGVSASIGPAPTSKPASQKMAGDGAPDRASDAPLDMFAPPDAQGAALAFDIADDEFSDRKKASAAAAGGDEPPLPSTSTSQKIPAPPSRASRPSLQAQNEPAVGATSVPSKWGPLGDERVRFVAGVLLAVLLGFIPAHFIAKMKEDSANDTIDRKVIAAQQAADTPEVYANLERMRTDQLGRKEDEQRNAALIGFAIWALAGGGIAFAWFKKIPWDA